METGTTLTVNPECIVPDLQLYLANTVEHNVPSKSVDEEILFSNIDIKIEHPDLFLNKSTSQESVESILPHDFEDVHSNSLSNLNSSPSQICGQCSDTFATLLELKRHELKHTTQEETNQNVCKICSIEFVFREGLLKHMRFHATYTCRYFHCKEVFRSIALRKKHEEKHIVVEAVQKDQDKSPKTSVKLRNVNSHEGKKRSKTATTKLPVKMKSPRVPISRCPPVPKSKTQTLKRKRSVEKIVRKSKPKINQSSVVFSSKRQKMFHVSEPIISTRLRSRKVNLETTKTQDTSALECDQCKKKFSKHSNLVQHMRLHSNEKRFQCRSCSLKFIDRTQRRRHEVSKHNDGVGRYQCDQCDATAETPSALDSHKRKHTGERPFSCEVCGKTFTLKSHLVSHKRIHTGEKPYKCNDCDAKFGSTTQRKRHVIMAHTTEKSFVCDKCDAQFAENSRLLKHERTIHLGEKPYKCRICDMKFAGTTQRKRHERAVHTMEKPFKCRNCDAKFADTTQRKRHEIALHSDDGKPYKCKECDAQFSDTTRLKIHVRRVHTGETPYKCNECDEKFASTTQRRRHERSVHMPESEQRPHLCDECGKTFQQPGLLKRHLKLHNGERPFACDQCEARFGRKESLRVHLRAHAGIKPFLCSYCPLKCATRREIKVHEMTHTKEKPFTCEICEHKFAHKQGLKLHIRTHTGEKPYSCEYCNKSFHQFSSLKFHISYTHSKPEDKKFVCETCGKRFFRSNEHKRHIITHTGVKPYKCHQCEKAFTQSSRLTQHILIHGHSHNSNNLSTEDKKLVCKFCGKKFTRNYDFKRHILTHSGECEVSGKCNYCALVFPNRSKLKYHIQQHHSAPKDKKHACETCGKKFFRHSDYKRHLVTHTGVKPYKCNSCEKAFTQSSRLKHHIRNIHGNSFNNLSEPSGNNDDLNFQENSVVNNLVNEVALHSAVMIDMTTMSANRNEEEYFENDVQISNSDRRHEVTDLQLAKLDNDKHSIVDKILEASVPQDWTSQNLWSIAPL